HGKRRQPTPTSPRSSSRDETRCPGSTFRTPSSAGSSPGSGRCGAREMDLRRLAPLALLVPAVAAGATLKPHWPKDQSIRYELGAAASRVDELDARWAPAKAERGHAGDAPGDDSDCARDVTFRYAQGRAPTTIAHTPRL